MPCNKKTIPEFTKKQIEECKKCKHISKKEIWCCLFGVWVKEKGRIITPSRKIIQPPTLSQMAVHFAKAMAKWAKKGFKTVGKEMYFRRRLICIDCTSKRRCPKCGCSLWAKAALASEECPEGKW